MSWQSYRQAVDVLRHIDAAAAQARGRILERHDRMIAATGTVDRLSEDEQAQVGTVRTGNEAMVGQIDPGGA